MTLTLGGANSAAVLKPELPKSSLFVHADKPRTDARPAATQILAASPLATAGAQLHNATFDLATRTAFLITAQRQGGTLAEKLTELRTALEAPDNRSAGAEGKREQQARYKTLQSVEYEEVLESRDVTRTVNRYANRDVFADQPIYETRDVTELRPVHELRDITEQRAIYETRDVTEQRPVYGMRDITEERPVYENRPIYNDLTITSTIKLDKAKVSDQKITAGSQFTIQVGDGEVAQVTFVSDTEMRFRIGSGATQVYTFDNGGKEWRTALVSALNTVSGLNASIDGDQMLVLSTTDGSSMTLASGTGDPLSKLGLTSGIYELEPATITGTKSLTGWSYQSWKDASADRDEKFAVRVGNGPVATIEFFSETELRLDLGDGSGVQQIQFWSSFGAWRDGLLTALNRIGGINASFNANGQLQIASLRDDTAVTLADLKGDSLKDLGLTAGTMEGAIVGYEQVQTGTQTVVIGQEQVQVGEETVVVGQEQVQVGEETVVIGQEQVQIGEEAVVIGQEQVQVGTQQVQVGTERYVVGRETIVVGTQEVTVLQQKLVDVASGELDAFETGEAAGSGVTVISEDLQALLKAAGSVLDDMRNSLKAAGFDLHSDSGLLGLDGRFLEGLDSGEAISERIEQLETVLVGLNGGRTLPNLQTTVSLTAAASQPSLLTLAALGGDKTGARDSEGSATERYRYERRI